MFLAKEIDLIECTIFFLTKNLSFSVNHYLELVTANKTASVRQKLKKKQQQLIFHNVTKVFYLLTAFPIVLLFLSQMNDVS